MHKNRLKILAICFLVISLAGPSRAQWKPAAEFQLLPIDNFQALAVVGNTLFAGSGAGVSRSQDGGESWTFISNGLTSTDVQAIVALGAHVFAGTHGGVFRSSDNGDTWTKVNNGLDDTYIQALAVAGTDLFAATNTDVFRSRDTGNSWSRMQAGTSLNHSQALIVKGDTLFAGTMNDVFRSSDHGETWIQAGIMKPAPFVSPINDIRDFAVIGGYLFAASSSQGVFRSADDGATWLRLNSGLTDTRAFSLAAKGGELFAGTYGSGVFRSLDSGLTWSPAANPESPGTGPTGAVYDLVCKDSLLYVATSGMYGGDVLRTRDGGFSWVSLHDRFTLIGTKEIGSLTSLGPYLFTRTAKGIFRSSDGGSSWGFADKGVTGTPILSLSTDGSNLFAMTPDGLFRSSSGSNWSKTQARPGFPQINSLAMVDSILLAATPAGLFRSQDHGITWKVAGFADTSLGFVAADGSNLVVAGYSASSEIYRSSNKGISWTPVLGNLPDANMRFLAVHHSVFFAGTEAPGLYISKNNGAAWTKSDLGIDANVWGLVADDSSLFLGTDAGVYQSNDIGETWKPASRGLNPGSVVTDLALSDSQLIVSISGEGLWRRPRSELPAPIAPAPWGKLAGSGRNPRMRILPGADLEFVVPSPGLVTLGVYDLQGREVVALGRKELTRGVHHASLDKAGLARGLYFLRMLSPGVSETLRLYIER